MKAIMKKTLSLILAISMLASFCVIGAAAEGPSVYFSTRMEEVEAGEVYKLVISVNSPNGLSNMSTILSYDNELITLVDCFADYAALDVTTKQQDIYNALNIVLQDARRTPYAASGTFGYPVGGRTGVQVDLYSINPITSMTEAMDVFELYFRMVDGKSVDDLAKGSFKIETDKSEGSILANIYNEVSIVNAAGLTITDKAPGGDVTYNYLGQADDGIAVDLVYTGSDKQSLDTLSLSAESAAVTVDGKSDKSVTLTVTAKDTDGDNYPTTEVSYQFDGGATGATLSGSTITIPAKAAEGTIKVAAQLAGKTSNEVSITVNREPAAAASVELYRDNAKVGAAETLIIPVEGESKYTYTTKVLDQYGDEMKDAAIEWTFTDGDDKVSFADGVVTVKAGAVKDTQYTLSAAVSGTEVKTSVAITVKDIEISWPDASVKKDATYGETLGEMVTISGGSASINGAAVEGTFTVKNSESRPNAGKASYVINFTSKDGVYNMDSTAVEFDVAPKAITITGVTATDRAYDQTTTVGITGGTLEGVLAGDEVNATIPATGTVASANVGTDLAVTLDAITLDNANYTLTQPTGITVDITKAEITALDVTSVAPVTVLASDVNSMDDVKGKIPVTEATATFGGNLSEKVTISWTTGDSFAAGTDKTYTFTGTVGTDNLDGSKLTALSAQVIVTVKYPVDVTVTAPAGVTFGETVGDPSAAQVEAGYGVAEDAQWKFEYEGVDGTTYARSETKPTQAGTYVVYATLVSETHAGSGKSDSFVISPKSIANAVVTLSEDFSAVYTGSAITPEPTVTLGETVLVKDTDFTVSYTDNVNAGTATVVVTGKGNYGETASTTFEIAKAPLAEMTPSVTGTAQVGSVLTAKLDGVASSEYTWHWYYVVDGEPDYAEITAAQGKASFVVTADLSNKEIYAEAVSNEINYTGVTLSSASVTVAQMAVSGTVAIKADSAPIAAGTVLTASASVTPAVELSYQWYVDGAAVEGATSETYTVAEADADKSITVEVKPVSADYTGSVVSAPVVVGKSVLTGTLTLALDAETNTISVTTAIELPAESYQIVWLRNGVVTDVVGDTYQLSASDKGAEIIAKAVPANEEYTGELYAEAGVAVPATAPAAPTVSASAGSGQVTISWSVSDNGGAPVIGYTVQCGENAPIELDATVTSYTFGGLENGTEYTFTVKATNDVGASEAGSVAATPKAPSGGGSSGGGSTVSQYTITVKQSEGGKIAPETVKVEKGKDQSFTITADEGYVLSDVLVDGKSVGVVSSYTFENVSAGHTIEAVFEELAFQFSDVDASSWAAPYIYALYEQGIVDGVGGNLFAPTRSITRAEFVKLLAGAAGVKDEDLSKEHSAFTDVEQGSWYEPYVIWAVENEVATGTSDTTFAPTALITRQEMATMLYRFAVKNGVELPESAEAADFADADSIADWAAEAVSAIQKAGIIDGVGNNTFAPTANATREQACKVLAGYLELTEKA